MSRSNKTLEEILEYIFYQNPTNQDEIADDLKITRRYVTKLLKPLLDEGIVKKVYVIDLKKYDEIYGDSNSEFNPKDYSTNILIKNLENMSNHVKNQLELSFESVIENDEEKAKEALELDYITNNMFEKIRSSVETVVNLNPHFKLSKILLFNEVAYNFERIGDYCSHLNKFIINNDDIIDDKILYILKKMYKYAQMSISYSTDAFIDGSVDLKGNLRDTEEKMHQRQSEAMKEIAIHMSDSSLEDIETANYYIYLTRVIKAFERIGDISVEIMDIAVEFHRDIPRTTVPRYFRDDG